MFITISEKGSEVQFLFSPQKLKMRSKNEILECLITCEKSHKKALNEYNKLNQIDALSSTGYNLEKTINNLN